MNVELNCCGLRLYTASMTPQETALLVAGVGVIGTLLGASIGQVGSLLVARHTLAGQRVLARDQAIRTWRANLITPVLEHCARRIAFYDDVLRTSLTNDVDALKALLSDTNIHEAMRVNSQVVVVGDPEFEKACHAFIMCDNATMREFRLYLMQVSGLDMLGVGRMADTGLLADRYRSLANLMSEVHRAAEAYIFRA